MRRRMVSAIRCSRKRMDIRIEHPIHPLPQNTDVERIQRIVLAAPRPKPIGKPDNGKRPLSPVRLRDVGPYAKRPFAGPEQVLAYLSRYTHRVAISNSRL